jgi:hypothetical protein
MCYILLAEQVYSTVSHFISTNSIVSGNVVQIMWFMIEQAFNFVPIVSDSEDGIINDN